MSNCDLEMKATATATRRSARAKAAGKKAKISTAPAAVAAAPTRHIDWRGKRITLFGVLSLLGFARR